MSLLYPVHHVIGFALEQRVAGRLRIGQRLRFDQRVAIIERVRIGIGIGIGKRCPHTVADGVQPRTGQLPDDAVTANLDTNGDAVTGSVDLPVADSRSDSDAVSAGDPAADVDRQIA